MECPNCQFQNTPGLKSCVRCMTRLDLAAVDFIPPRSRDRSASRALSSRFRRGWYGARDAGAALAARARGVEINWPVMFWSLVPGLGHVRAGFRRTGTTLLAAWVALLLLAALSVGHPFAWLFGAAVLGLHCIVYSLLLAKPLARVTLAWRLVTGVGVYVVLLFGLYIPALLIGRNMIQIAPVRGIVETDTIRDGDLLIGGGAWLRPDSWRRGDLVFYRIDAAALGNVVIEAGYGVDRIIGVAGDEIDYDGEQLTVNDLPVPDAMMPIGGMGKMPSLSIAVAPGEVAILPSALRWRFQGGVQYGLSKQMLVRVTRVPEGNLRSRLWWRLRPWRRIGAVH